MLCLPTVNKNSPTDVVSHPKRPESSKLTAVSLFYSVISQKKSSCILFDVKTFGNTPQCVKGTLLPCLFGAPHCERSELKLINLLKPSSNFTYHQV
jgi:hypothetical protein